MRQLILTCFLFLVVYNFKAQGPSFYDLTFDEESLTAPYKPSNTNYAYVKSKRGTSGLNTTNSADSIKGFTISKIILVFSEDTPEEAETREEYNQERWENMILTYPEFFQEKTTYKNVCQCTAEAGGDNFKQAQGFYVYYKSNASAAAPAAPKAEPVVTKTSEAPKTPAATEVPLTKKEEPVAAAPSKTDTKPVEKAPKTEAIAEAPKQTETKTASNDEEEAAPAAPKKKPAGTSNKPRKAKDPKACRPACYGYGDEDLASFFMENIKLNKKQKRKAKNATCEVKLQLHFDGSIKKTTVAGPNPEINILVQDAVQRMNKWNAAVKAGTAIKSEVRIKLVFDKATKSIKPSEIINSPKPNPKCKCVSDSEIFD